MARKRIKPPEVSGDVPQQLQAPVPEFWAEDVAVEQLALAVGISPAVVLGNRDRSLPFERFELFRAAWAHHHGVDDLRAAGVYLGRDIHAGFPNTRRERLVQAISKR